MNNHEEIIAAMIFADLYSDDVRRKGEAIALLLCGELDEPLISFTVRNGTDEAVARENLEAIKNSHRNDLQRWLDREDRKLAAERQETAVKAFNSQHRESEYGTTAEIAEKLGISKKQVRKLKQNGTLDEAMQALDTQ